MGNEASDKHTILRIIRNEFTPYAFLVRPSFVNEFDLSFHFVSPFIYGVGELSS